MPTNDRVQDLLSRNGALKIALEECLAGLAVLYGSEAHTEIKSLREDLIRKFKSADISPEREMEHAKMVGPAIEVLEVMFDDALGRLKG
jgi:hypothetical protein